MKELAEIAAEKKRRGAVDAIDDSRITIGALTHQIESELQKHPELKEMFDELQFRKELYQAATYYRIKGGNQYRLGMLSTVATVGFGIAGAVTAWPYFGAAVVALICRTIFLENSENKYKDVQEVLQREQLGDVKIQADAIDDYITEVNQLIIGDGCIKYSVKAEPLKDNPDQIWIAVSDSYSSYKVANLFKDQALVTDFYTLIEMPKIVPLERLPFKWLKEVLGLQQSQFSCPAHGISRARDQQHYKAAQQIREVALRYAV